MGVAAGNRADELAELSRDFDHMAEQIESLISSQRRLLADISHELRSPLARLTVALGLTRLHANPECTDALDRIELEAGRLNTLDREPAEAGAAGERQRNAGGRTGGAGSSGGRRCCRRRL